MDNTRIVHFIGFVTNLHFEEFSPLWESYIRRITEATGKNTVIKIAEKRKNLFRYLSRHESGSTEFRFTYTKSGVPVKFPERKATVISAGGYQLVQQQCPSNTVTNDVKVLAFLPPGETELNFYHRQLYRHLNIYEAYFENCIYSYILEFYIQKQDAEALVKELKSRNGTEAAVFQE